ncbi:MAG: geranylgeranyl reductase family protein [Austwickia sp.]|nr:geranylgeranyl reductase family protein [Austwickia sp.]MBK8436128.1 geranylgeranyl reductase family protein [Austwickia sp.]MBK9101807.1 geranylgeranyl reductase family protein [Austwickia sp.]
MNDAVTTAGPGASTDPRGDESADVIVVGAGPGGSTTAAYLAMHGLDVLLLEKGTFPRDKVCGDGLTPRAVRELIHLGVPTEGWVRNKGLRIVGGGHRLQLDWPDVAEFPPYGMVRRRAVLDETLARFAAARGARLLERTNVTAAIRADGANGPITGVLAKVMDERGRATGATRTFRAPVVVAADGNSSRISLAMGREKREDRPMGVAVRTYYESPSRTDDDYLESWLELWVPADPHADPASLRDPATKKILLPGYGWLFGTGDGMTNIGLGMLDTSPAFGTVDYKDVLRRWVATMPAQWTCSDDTRTAPIRGAALPMAFNRQPLYADGLLLVGDAGGMVNPFNGEGIDYAMESGRIAAEIIAQALARGDAAHRERVLASYQRVMKAELGGYFTLGRGFAQLIGHPEVMRLAVKYGLPLTPLMRVLLKVMANLGEPRGGRFDDRLLQVLSRIAPSA